ncbi:uroporphyrinogen-III synthase [Sphingomonas sp. MMSM20]|uniref:uroporphyrinogen-III synthase n=1 Tax=Sphingomonas lycopersici TaxID=2951807 RepID=UPI002238D27E|nr:uroporphyrinogen-III synthase [Sphingomonas lycopersici]
MTRAAIVLRPEPGNARTIARLAALGVPALALPLFAVEPVAWETHGGAFDSLLITSANAVRHAGAGLTALGHLPVIAVGEESADAARAGGLTVAVTGTTDGVAALDAARAAGFRAPLHLAGQEHIAFADVVSITVYRSAPLDLAAGALAAARDRVALLHSPRAARRFAELVDRDAVPRETIRLAALSEKIAAAAGAGWDAIASTPRPDDALLVALAASLAS